MTAAEGAAAASGNDGGGTGGDRERGAESLLSAESLGGSETAGRLVGGDGQAAGRNSRFGLFRAEYWQRKARGICSLGDRLKEAMAEMLLNHHH